MFARRDYRLIKSLSIETKQKREPPKKGDHFCRVRDGYASNS